MAVLTATRLSPIIGCIAVAVVAIGIRILALNIFHPAVYNDTYSYVEMAGRMLTHSYATYNGGRTPGYASFLLLGGLNPLLVYVLQSLLGATTAICAYWLTFRLSKTFWLAVVVGLATALHLDLLLYEASLLSESLATFLLTSSCFLALRASDSSLKEPSRALALLSLILISGYMVLVRPNLIIAIPFLACIFWINSYRRQAVVFFVTCCATLLGWSICNYLLSGYFGPTSYAGVNAMKITGSLVAPKDDQYRDIRATYLYYRDPNVRGDHYPPQDAIFAALGPIQEEQNLTYIQASNLLVRFAKLLIVENPLGYTRAVIGAWTPFWAVATQLGGITQSTPAVRSVVMAFGLPFNLFDIATSGIFLLVSFIAVCATATRRLLMKRADSIVITLVFATLILAGSLSQAMVEYGENGRYSTPFRPLIIVCAVVLPYLFTVRRRSLRVRPIK